MADVYLGRLTGPGGFEKRLVIKVIRPELAERREFCELFVAEAKITVALTHSNIVPVYELGMADGQYYLAMELVDGPTVHQLVFDPRPRRGGPLPAPLSAYVTEQVLRGLDYAHRQGVIHCDMSSANVMCSREGEVKILDFGIAAHVHAQKWSGQTSMPGGSQGYMAPEQISGAQPSQRTDLFATGVLLFEMATGRRFGDGDEGARRATYAEAPATLPPPLRRVVETATAKRIEDRYADAAAMLTEVSRYLREVDAPTQSDLSKLVRRRAPDERRIGRVLGADKGLEAPTWSAKRKPGAEGGPRTSPVTPAAGRRGARGDMTPSPGEVQPVLLDLREPGTGEINLATAADRELTPPLGRFASHYATERELTPPLGRRSSVPGGRGPTGSSRIVGNGRLPETGIADREHTPALGRNLPETGEPGTGEIMFPTARQNGSWPARETPFEARLPLPGVTQVPEDPTAAPPIPATPIPRGLPIPAILTPRGLPIPTPRGLPIPGPGSTVTFASRPARVHATWRTYLGAALVLAIIAVVALTTERGLHRRSLLPDLPDPINDTDRSTRPTPVTGTLLIHLPTESSLKVDGRVATPGASFPVAAGKHRLEASAPGRRPMTVDIDVRAGETTQERLVLPWTVGHLHLGSAPVGAQVTLNGEQVGATPLELDVPLDAPATLRLSAKGYATALREILPSHWVAASPSARANTANTDRPEAAAETAEMPDPPEMRLRVELDLLQRGTLTVGSTPWAQVFVDGERRGDTPLRRLSLPAGPHALRLSCPPQSCKPARELRLSVTVESGRESRRIVNFLQQPPNVHN